jgi:hypothetical protein
MTKSLKAGVYFVRVLTEDRANRLWVAASACLNWAFRDD